MEIRPSTWFEDAVNIPAWLAADDAAPSAKSERERRIARRLPAELGAPGQVRQWWSHIEGSRELGIRFERARRGARWVLNAVGLLLGFATGQAVFFYDGAQPVNVLTVLGVLVAVPLTALLISLLLIPGRLPVLKYLQDLVAGVHPGALASQFLQRWLKRNSRGDGSDASDQLFGWPRYGQPHTQRFAVWQTMVLSQSFAVSFYIGALAAAASLIVFTDLAFGWSTTLELPAASFQRWVDVIARPWSGWLHAALPSHELIAQSQYFRLQNASRPILAAPLLAGWWPFLVMTITVYGLMPRVLLLIIASQRLRAAERKLLWTHPQVIALLGRLRAPRVQQRALEHESVPHLEREASPAPRIQRSGGRAVIWANALTQAHAPDWLSTTVGASVDAALDAGGNRDFSGDAETQRALAKHSGDVIVVCKAYEPPTLDLTDFLKGLRTHIGSKREILVALITAEGRLATNEQVHTWRLMLARLEDARLHVLEAA